MSVIKRAGNVLAVKRRKFVINDTLDLFPVSNTESSYHMPLNSKVNALERPVYFRLCGS